MNLEVKVILLSEIYGPGSRAWVHGPKNISDGFKRKPVLPNEFRIFWGGLIICPVLWALFGLMALFTLKVKLELTDKEFEFLFSSFGSQFV